LSAKKEVMTHFIFEAKKSHVEVIPLPPTPLSEHHITWRPIPIALLACDYYIVNGNTLDRYGSPKMCHPPSNLICTSHPP
jgi:hypothetical protein